MNWLGSLVFVASLYATDCIGLNVMGWRPGGTICAKWFLPSVDSQAPCSELQNYRAGGVPHAFDLLKAATLSAMTPYALASAPCGDLPRI